ncbi:DUF1771-domain-containing protein [Rhizopogon salebrosus TDB-379]|nr:DUF1771-domain-containing protein [Rhizopogon salebrosus TDB-379]
MQTFVPSVLAALQKLLKGPAWLLQKVIGIFSGWNESLSTPIPSSYSCSPSDSPYELHGIPSQQRTYQSQPQISVPSRYSTANRTRSQHSPYPPHRQASTSHPTRTASLAPRDAPVAKPVQYTQPVTIIAPEVAVAPLVIDPPEDHESLRFKARREGDRMSECFSQSQEAYVRGEKRLAKELSLSGEAHKENMVRLHKEASAKIFQANNQRLKPNTVDLHGLRVTEAEFYFEKTVQEVQDRRQSLRVIVGKGNHSDGGMPKIKPAIQTLGESMGMTVNVDPGNDGCLVVTF